MASRSWGGRIFSAAGQNTHAPPSAWSPLGQLDNKFLLDGARKIQCGDAHFLILQVVFTATHKWFICQAGNILHRIPAVTLSRPCGRCWPVQKAWNKPVLPPPHQFGPEVCNKPAVLHRDRFLKIPDAFWCVYPACIYSNHTAAFTSEMRMTFPE